MILSVLIIIIDDIEAISKSIFKISLHSNLPGSWSRRLLIKDKFCKKGSKIWIINFYCNQHFKFYSCIHKVTTCISKLCSLSRIIFHTLVLYIPYFNIFHSNACVDQYTSAFVFTYRRYNFPHLEKLVHVLVFWSNVGTNVKNYICTCIYIVQYTKKLRILNILNFFVWLIYVIRACSIYELYKKLRIFNILNFFCVVYILKYAPEWLHLV